MANGGRHRHKIREVSYINMIRLTGITNKALSVRVVVISKSKIDQNSPSIFTLSTPGYLRIQCTSEGRKKNTHTR